jgi:low affinity Fe/Cu permease
MSAVQGRVRDGNGALRTTAELHHLGGPTGFSHFANWTARAAGRPVTFALCCLVILGWAVTGPVFRYSDTWQLIINTGTTIVTFQMVFLIQNTQNRDGAALQAKLDELIRATEDARNAYMHIEELPEEELDKMREDCEQKAGNDT